MKISSKAFSKLLRKIALYLLISFTILMIVYFIFRNTILQTYIDKKCKAFQKKYAAALTISKASFSGFNDILLENLSIIPNQNDTLVSCNRLLLKVRLLPLFFGKIRFGNLQMQNTYINISSSKDKDNYSFLFKKDSSVLSEIKDSNINYSLRLNRIFSFVFSSIPDKISIKNLNLHADIDSNVFNFLLPELEIKKHKFQAYLGISDSDKKSICRLNGEIDKKKKRLFLNVSNALGKKIQLPLLYQKYGLKVNFDTLQLSFSASGNNSLMNITGNALATSLTINHKKIAENDVFFEKLGCNFSMNVIDNYFELDSSSSIFYNRIVINPYLRFSIKPQIRVVFKINNEFAATDLFESLPVGMFSNFEGFKAKGKLHLFVNFELDMQQPDSLKFDASLTGKDFAIVQYGVTDFRKINGTFTHTAYVNGIPVKTFEVGPENPAYTPLTDMPQHLKDAVLISENGGFFFSDGFNTEAFRESIIANIKAGRFVRGGSTIDMQLVKNVFLNKNKTIARKAEEILITWLINYHHLCSKEKMFEVYLNLIEWGPGIYGISEASAYYFSKKPAQLTVPESIFLASIIPRPRWFKSSFDADSKLSAKNQHYFSLIAGKLITKGSATTSDTLDMLKKVELKGAAKEFMKRDTVRFN